MFASFRVIVLTGGGDVSLMVASPALVQGLIAALTLLPGPEPLNMVLQKKDETVPCPVTTMFLLQSVNW